MAFLKILILALAILIMRGVDLVGLGINQIVLSNPEIYAVQAVLDAAVISYAINQSRWSGWKLILAIFLAYYSVSSFLVGIEGYYLSDIVTPDIIIRIFINGALVAGLGTILAVTLQNKMDSLEETSPQFWSLPRTWGSWLSHLILAGFIYLLLFIFTGLLIFQPLAVFLEPQAGPAYIAAFQPADPFSILIFQFLRGVIWVLLTFPLVHSLCGFGWEKGLVVSITYALLMAPLNLVPNGLPIGIQIAHTVEVFTGNFLFGWFVALGLGYPTRIEKPKYHPYVSH